jgi:hypothetical protein
VIPLNQLIPECLLALGGAFLLGNLAAYIRLRPAWRDAKDPRGGQAAKDGAEPTTKPRRTGSARTSSAGTGSADSGTTGSAGTNSGPTGSGTNNARTTNSGTTNSGSTGSGPTGRDQAGSGGGKAAAERTGRDRARSGGAKAAAGPKRGASTQVSARVRDPTASGSKLPSRTRVLVNVLIGLVITAAALATLIRA